MPILSKLTPLDKIIIIRKCKNLSPTQKAILYSIVSRLGKKEFCYPGLSTLMEDSGLKSRTSLIENLTVLEQAKILWIIPPGDGFKSNRYGIDFNLLVRDAYQTSTLNVPVQYARRTRLVRDTYSKGNIKQNLNEIKKETSEIAENARAEIRRVCKIKRN